MVKRSVIFLVLGIFNTHFATSQVIGGQIEKLQKLYVKEKYEDCAYKAEVFIEGEKYRKNPEPYLYLSMCYYQLSKSDDKEIKEYYVNPLKDALKWAYKFRAKDKKDELYSKNIEFINSLRNDALAQSEEFFSQGNYRKAVYNYKLLLKMDKENYHLQFMKGVCDSYMRNTSESYRNITTSIEKLSGLYANSDYKADPITQPVLIDAIVIYTDHLVEQNFTDSAKVIINFGNAILPDDEKVKMQYDKLVNGI